jgi:hypothetical protein
MSRIMAMVIITRLRRTLPMIDIASSTSTVKALDLNGRHYIQWR